jgi:hypothetical protein
VLDELATWTQAEMGVPEMLSGPIMGRLLPALVTSSGACRLLEVSLPAAEGLDEARVEVTPATADEVERIAAELTLEQRRLVESGELVPVAVEAWASYADREFVTVPRRLGLLERDAFPDEVGRVVEDVTRQLHAQLTKANAHVSAWELRSAAQVDLAPQLVRWSVFPASAAGGMSVAPVRLASVRTSKRKRRPGDALLN